MKLYHGTNEKHLKAILAEGIKPRGKKPGNWKHTVKSRADAVYLSLGYAPYFAAQATPKGRMAIIEIDTKKLNPWKLAPDEDCLAQADKSATRIPGLMDRTAAYRERLQDYTGENQWWASVNLIGNCCHLGEIEPDAITRVAVADIGKTPSLLMACCDPSITITNWRLIGSKYRGLTKWIFGDDLGEDAPHERGVPENTPPSLIDAFRWSWLPPNELERAHIEVRNINLTREAA